MRNYQTWGQVAGYFDGDGTIATSDLSNQPYKIGLSLIFVDQSLDQIKCVRCFLQKEGIVTSNTLRTSKGTAWMVAVSRFDSVVSTLVRLEPFLCKKAKEARAAICYYQGRITGNELLRIFQEEVEAERRERRQRKVIIDVPYTYPEGKALMIERRREALRDALGKFRAKVTPEDYEEIRAAYFAGAKPVHELVSEYTQYSRETIRRILGKGRGYVFVRGIGRVSG